ncbi:MAG: hypothetical protein DRR19_30405 [Candidatus Parabeggiatoa sp. nov. 1]|nr:MAG: hypothetical protein DRR19_30405 [Gammaproteobacteria bacterium]
MDSFATLLKKHLKNCNLEPAELAKHTSIPKESFDVWLDGSKFPNECSVITECAGAMRLSPNDRRALFKAARLPRCVFADLLSEYMRRANISQEKLAKDIGVSRKTVGKWLREEHLPSKCEPMLKCADALNLSMVQFNELLEASGLDCQLLSPCVVDKPITNPKQFFGRRDEIKRILDQWSRLPLQNIAVTGAKGSGKTSLLYYLRKNDKTPLENGVFVNFKDPRMCDKQTLLFYLIKQLKMPVPEPCDLYTFMDTVTEHLDTPTFILLDDVDRGMKNPSLDQPFWDGLRALSNDIKGGKLAFLTTSREKPWEIAQTYGKESPFFNIFGHVLTLGPLLEDEACELVTAAEHTAQLPGERDAEAWEWILEQSQRWPMSLQKLADCYIKTMKYGEPARDKWREACLERIKPYLY